MKLLVQVYLGALRGRDLGALLRGISARGLTHCVLHGFPTDHARKWEQRAKIANAAFLKAYASWGLDSRADNGNLREQEKGRIVGEVLARPDCCGGLLDAEGAWDADSELAALRFGDAMCREAPDALVGDQPWFAIDSHGDLRQNPLPIEDGGVFGGFPVDEFAVRVNWRRFRQMYCNNFTGRFGSRRYEATRAWMDRDWAAIQPAMRAAGLDRPLGVTIQGYAWELHDLAHCLLRDCVSADTEVVMWCEPEPAPETWAVIDGIRWMQRHPDPNFQGLPFARPGCDPVQTVRNYQADYNRSCVNSADMLVVDGKLGANTLRTMGIRVPR